jgi:cobalt-zinc-cadmium efflux system membrane fusion protein
MSEPSSTPEPVQPGQESIDRRAWSRERQLRVAAVATVVVIVALAGLWFGGRLFGAHETAPTEPAAPAGTFRASPQQLKTLTIDSVAVHGFVSEEITEGKIAVNGDRATPVFSPYSGRITRVIAGLGDTVKKGAPLALLEASEYVQAQNDLATAVAQRKLARITETRKHALYEAKGGSLADWQQAQADLTAAETAVYSVRNRLKILGQSDARIDELESARSIDPAATIGAPIAGVVVDRQVGPGQYVQAGAGTPVFTIADPSSVWLLANVREADSGSVRSGDVMIVRVPAYPKREFQARVTYVAALVDPGTHRLPVRAEIENRDGALKPEMFASFRIQTSEATQSPAIPEAAVVYEGEAAHVWVVQGEGLLAYRAIRTGRSNDGLIEVLEGLEPGERIVTKGGVFIDQAAASGNT